MSPEMRACQNCKQNFTIESEDFAFYEKMKVPAPKICPECDIKHRMMWRNERCLYWRTCDLCKKKIMSMYPDQSVFPVYCRDCWISDAWDPLSYGQEYDFSQPFFEQFKSLERRVPRVALLHYGTSVRCDFTNYTRNTKDVYLSYGISTGENVFFSALVDWSKDTFDSFMMDNPEIVYEGFNSDRCYNVQYVVNARDCTDCLYVYDCVNCEHCFMSGNLRNKHYVFRGEQLSKEAYERALSEIDFGSFHVRKNLFAEFTLFMLSAVHKHADIVRSVSCTGNYLTHCKNVKDSYSAHDSEDMKHAIRIIRAKDIYNVFSCGEGSERVYRGILGGKGSSNIKFFANADVLRESEYTGWCSSSSHLFGCVGLRTKEYCILNRQYSKDEYETLIPKIIEHMNAMPYINKQGKVYAHGEFFPPEFSPFAYNETIAQEYFPLTKESAAASVYRWKDPDIKEYAPTIISGNLPDHIKDVPDSITQEIIQCGHHGECHHQCSTAFKIIPQELEFYRRMNLPLPRLCPNCRHYERLNHRNPLKLWHRQCMKPGCMNEFETSYAPERPEIIYCESCYQKEVV